MQISRMLALFICCFCLMMFSAKSFAVQLEPMASVPVPPDNPQTPEKIELGKKLFFDRRLSGDGTMSCAACHIPEQAFTDGEDIALSYPTTKNWRNTPSIINAAFYKYLFHDGRAKSLEEQALMPVGSSFEMNLNSDFLEEKLKIVPEYVAAFKEVFNADVTKERIAMALASFERTIISRNSPLDRYLSGDYAAISEDARRGLALFTGKAKCLQCHYGPHMSDDKFHALNVPENPDIVNDPRKLASLRFVAKLSGVKDYGDLKEDLGRYLVTKDQRDWKAFKTPDLREIARTAPYMHNGVFATLDQVIQFLNDGGGEGNSELTPLGLSDDEKISLKTFLTEALTGDDIKIKNPEIP